jgi:hypothetical protein
VREVLEAKLRMGILVTILVLASAGLGILSANLGVTLHELFLHNLIAWLLGCPASSDTNIYTGITSFACDPANPYQMIIIGLSAPLGAFFIGLFLWMWDRDSILRFIGLIVMMYSSIPSLLPTISGSDMAFAIAHGFNPIFGWLIYVVVSGVFYFALLIEVIDKDLLDPQRIPFLRPSRCKGVKGSRLKACLRRKK